MVTTMRRMLAPALLAAALAGGCSMTEVQQEWKDPGYQGPAAHSVVVLCLPADSKEKECEDEFVGQLKKAGIAAIPGYGTTAASASKDEVMAKAREMGISRVLVSRFMKKRTQLEISPPEPTGRMMILPDPDMWYDYPRYEEQEYQVFATALYNAADGKAIWSAASDTRLTYSGEKGLEKGMSSYAKAMVKKLERQGLLAR